MDGNFREKLEEALRIKFRDFKFRGSILCLCSRNVNFELSTRDATFGFDETLAGKSGYVRLEERWSASVLSLAWEVSMSTKHDLRWCSHT